MRKFLTRLLLVFLSAVICLSGVASAADTSEDTLRVGLFYDSKALPGANLENAVGSGYRFGWYDADLAFHELGYTSQTQISMVKTQNVTLSNGNYVDGIGSVTVGCYHLQLQGSSTSFDGALDQASRVPGGFPAWIDGAYHVRVGAYTTKEEAEAARDELGLREAEIVGTSGYAVSVVVTKTGEPIFQFDGGSAYALGVQPGLDSSVKAVTWFKGYRYYGGFQYVRDHGGNLEVLNVVSLDDYVRGVLPYEMSNDWPLEALKAQAVPGLMLLPIPVGIGILTYALQPIARCIRASTCPMSIQIRRWTKQRENLCVIMEHLPLPIILPVTAALLRMCGISGTRTPICPI